MLKRIIGKKKMLMLILGIIVGILISVVGVYAATLIDSKNVTYDNSKSNLQSTNVQDALDELYDIVNMPLSSHIISLYAKSKNKTDITIGIDTLGTETITQASDINLMQDSDGNIRYYGSDPNNYIIFNGEKNKWRIIGVFDNRIKIIRDSIGTYAWDTNNKNNWPTSTLKKYLNETYYNTLINNNAQNMIDNVIWKLGGINSVINDNLYYQNLYVNNFFNYERNTEVYSDNSTTCMGKIGLIYPSDYGYATDLNKCNKILYGYGDNNCNINDWLFNSNIQWTITPAMSHSDRAFAIHTSGVIYLYYANSNTFDVHPTLYLKSDVVITGGNGSKDNPYQIKLS